MKSFKLLFLTFFFGTLTFAQVGINTTTIDPSAALQIQSGASPKGLLTPRMTTADRLLIPTPADGLIVYDTDLKFFFHYNNATSSWVKMSSDVNGRNKFKRIKSIADLAPELSGGKYVLATDTYYEVNGTILVDAPIDINNAYLVGLDANEDRLIKNSGILFQGTKGGTIKNLTISKAGGTLTVFDLTGDATGIPLVGTQNLIVRDCIIAGCDSVGSVSGFNLAFFAIVQYSGNATGITYSNTAQLLLSNIGWFGNNAGTFETFTGSFNLLQKLGGFSDVKSGAIGVDVSSNPTINSDAVLESVVFTGASTQYVKPYTVGTYSGYNFNNNWNVRSSGIPNETDADAVGSFAMDYAVGSGAATNFNSNRSFPTVIKKVEGVSASDNLFRFSDGGVNNRLVYLGKKKRVFQVTGSMSFQVDATSVFIIYVARNGTVISQSKIYGRGAGASDIVVVPINALVELTNSQFVEIYAQRYTGTNNTDGIVTPNMTITVK